MSISGYRKLGGVKVSNVLRVKDPNTGRWIDIPAIKGDPYELTDSDKEQIAQQAAELVPEYDDTGIKKQVEETKEDLSQLSQLMPEANPTVGKVLKVLSVNEDGSFVCEWADGSSGSGVDDVQVAGASVVQDGVATVPYAATNIPGVIMVGSGLEMPSSNKLRVWQAPDSTFRIGTDIGGFLPASKQHISAFYGLAKAAGHDEKNSTLPVGQYTPEAQAAIQQMLGILSVEEVLF